MEGVDFSDARPGAAALLAAGKFFVVRYVPYGGYSKGLTAAEVLDYRAHGIGIVFNFESTADRALSGRGAGIFDGLTAKAAAASLGIPADRPIYFSVDFNATVAQQPVIDAYLKGVASVLGLARTGVYGSYGVLLRCLANGTARWFWQTRAWSAGRIAGFAHLYQYSNGQNVNGSVDFDRSMKADFGQWKDSSMPQKGVTSAIPATVTVPTGTVLYDLDGTTKLSVYTGHELVQRYSPYAAGDQRAIFTTPHTGGPDRVTLITPAPGSVVELVAKQYSQADLDTATSSGHAAGVQADQERIRALLGV